MSMQVRTIDSQHLPYQWTDAELPHQLDCGVSMSAVFASMSELSKPIWVPAKWVEQLDRSWEDLVAATHDELSRRRRHNTWRGRPMPEKPAKIDHWAISAALPCDKLCYQIQWHTKIVERLVDEISETKTKEATVTIEPAAWLELRHKLSKHHVQPSDWSGEVEQEKYDELLAFLKRGELPHGVNMAPKHIPVELAIEKGTGLAAEKGVLAIEKGTALRGGNVKMG